MTDKPKHITIAAPSEMTILAARHLDATEGPVQVGTTVDQSARSAITTVLRYIATAHNSPAAPAASTAPLAAGLPLVQGRCPACGRASLFLGNGGHVTCSIIECPNPCAADELLHRARPTTALREHLAKAIDEAFGDNYQPGEGLDADAMTTTVLAALTQHLDIGEEEAWCKACRRVWDGPRHRCESDAEQRLAAIREALAVFNDRGVIRVGYSNLDIPTAGEVIAAVRAELDRPEQSSRTTENNREQPHHQQGQLAMAVCTTCLQPGATSEHGCPGLGEIQVSRHRGRGVVVEAAPQRALIGLRIVRDLAWPTNIAEVGDPDLINVADQVLYRVVGYDPGSAALIVELVEDWRPKPEEQP